MKILHRISLHTTDAIKRELSELGFSVGDGLITFEVDEGHPRWADVARFITRYDAFDMVFTGSTPAERAAATWLEIGPEWHAGYPQPEDGYLETTYDLNDYCPECGIGAVQKAPFRMRREPKWGSRGILQLNWVFDEYFAKRDVWERVFLPLGITSRPVLDHKSGAPLQTVVQCDFSAVADSPLALGDHPSRRCPRCERRKFLPWTRGCFPAFREPPRGRAVIKSREYFGDGAKAFRAVLVSQGAYRAIDAARVRGCTFVPVCS